MSSNGRLPDTDYNDAVAFLADLFPQNLIKRLSHKDVKELAEYRGWKNPKERESIVAFFKTINFPQNVLSKLSHKKQKELAVSQGWK